MKPVSRHRAIWLGQHIFPHEAAVRAWLSRRALTHVLDIDDVIQESYAILAGLDRVDHICTPRTYFFQVAKSAVLQALRRSRMVSLDALADADALQIPSNDPDPEQIAADRQELGRVEAVISTLPSRCREVFLLRKIQGLSQRDVAQTLGLSESTVEKHVIKALGILTHAIGRGGKRAVDASTAREQKNDRHARHQSRERAIH
ncbi:RNA polymerase sigma factor [Sphingomonas endolithica]|uniref:RNA polymerase sigma factor n=1 Tax=Sphingomonas endolithica TaxID=2972485 RepID=UPI0021B05A5A|nr:sigma-70 family RNA polymerase sigma factor [Sphingomonas sp. ZFBP2030]